MFPFAEQKIIIVSHANKVIVVVVGYYMYNARSLAVGGDESLASKSML